MAKPSVERISLGARGQTTPSEPLVGEALVKAATRCVENYPGRLVDKQGRPGGLIDFPAGLRPIIIGDLHTSLANLNYILHHESNWEDVQAGKAAFILVGDTVHDDQTGQMKDMTSSVIILEEIFRLQVAFPHHLYYLRGNHDTFDERLRKSGIAQGLEFKSRLLEDRGPAYVAAVEQFFDNLPLFVIGNGFVITHAGPVRGGCTRDQLVNVRDFPDYYSQLTWNRVNEFHGNPSMKEYGEFDIRQMLLILGLPSDTHFIVGHNRLDDGNRTGVWLNLIGIQNHHLLYSGTASEAPYLTYVGDQLVAKLAKPKTQEVYDYG